MNNMVACDFPVHCASCNSMTALATEDVLNPVCSHIPCQPGENHEICSQLAQRYLSKFLASISAELIQLSPLFLHHTGIVQRNQYFANLANRKRGLCTPGRAGSSFFKTNQKPLLFVCSDSKPEE